MGIFNRKQKVEVPRNNLDADYLKEYAQSNGTDLYSFIQGIRLVDSNYVNNDNLIERMKDDSIISSAIDMWTEDALQRDPQSKEIFHVEVDTPDDGVESKYDVRKQYSPIKSDIIHGNKDNILSKLPSKFDPDVNIFVIGAPLKEELEDVINHPNIMNLGYINYMDDLYDLIDLAIITDDGLTLHETLACQIPVVVVLGVKYGRYHGLSKVFDGAVIESNVDNISEKVNYALENYDQMYNSTKIYSEDIINGTDDLTTFLINHLSK